MSFLKFSQDLFLEKEELNRFKKFLDDDGFRLLFLKNSVNFGLFKNKIDDTFTNGYVYETAGLTFGYNEISAINSDGNYIYKEAKTLNPVPSDNSWYWIKITYLQSPIERGLYSIDTSGNLICTSGNGEFESILRGQPNFPSRIKFNSSTNNTLEYDVLEVIDNNNAVLQGDFISESDLQLIVVGTFTPSAVPDSTQKNIFQYDSCTLELVEETVSNTRPTVYDGSTFYLARVKNDGVNLLIEDKRIDFYESKADFNLRNIVRQVNPVFGVEKITYKNELTPQESNQIYVAWSYRTSNWSFNPELNLFTISTGEGGRYKNGDVSLFTDGDFDGWRLYVSSGLYYIITSSIKQSSQIKLYLDNAESSEFDDTAQEIIICPNSEEIELIFTANPSDNYPSSDRSFIFPINRPYGIVDLIVYKESGSLYNLLYRYKHLREYSDTYTPQSDSIGFYDEDQFDGGGNLVVSPSRTTYTSHATNGYIPLNLAPNAYSVFQTKVDVGDYYGVETFALSNSVPVKNLVVGTNRKYQYIDGTLLTLNKDLYINLADFRDYPTNTVPIRNGNSFILHFKQTVSLGNYFVRIVQDYVSTSSYILLKEFNIFDENFLNESEEGLTFLCTYTGSEWIIDNVNETKFTYRPYNQQLIDNSSTSIVSSGGGTYTLVASFTPLPYILKEASVNVNYQFDTSNGGGGAEGTIGIAIYLNGVVVSTITNFNYFSSGFFTSNRSIGMTFFGIFVADLAIGDQVDIYMYGSASFTPICTTTQISAELRGNAYTA